MENNPQIFPSTPTALAPQSSVIIQPSSPLNPKHTSCGLVTTGTFIILLGICVLGIGIYSVIKVGQENFAIATCCCGGLFTLAGLLATYGGSSVWSRKGSISISAVVAFFGIAACMAVIYFNMDILTNDNEKGKVCWTCHGKLVSDNINFESVWKNVAIFFKEAGGACDTFCGNAILYVVIIALSGMECILTIILFCVACCNTCRCCCCYKSLPTDGSIAMISSFHNVINPSRDYGYSRLEEATPSY